MLENDFPDIPGYTVLNRLGSGGMATIYLAEQHSFKRKVALKVMAPHLVGDPSFSKRFLREARIVAQLTHRHFVPVYEVGQSGDHHYMSMEYLPGGDLKSLLAKGLTLIDGFRVCEEVADALNFAAGKNFVHRDIKPENILFREDGNAVICDFGIARDSGSSTQMTQVGAVIGTPRYMSPEQAQGNELDGRSDLYSLGVILFEILTGRVPYDSDSAVTTGIMHITDPIPRLPDHLETFQGLIDRAMAKKPEDRFQTGREMVLALREQVDREYDLIVGASPTVVLSRDEMESGLQRRRASQHTSGRARSRGASHGGRHTDAPARARSRNYTGRVDSDADLTEVSPFPTGESAGRRATPAPGQPWYAGKKLGMGLGVMLLLGVIGGGYFFLQPEPELPVSSDIKVQELNRKATESIDADRLFSPQEDNAQYYLTSALILSPQDPQAVASIARLFTLYLERADDNIEGGQLEDAGTLLNKASQITHLIVDDDLIDELSDLRRGLMKAQKEAVLSAEKDTEIQTLMAEADEKLKLGNLTSPFGDNAYDRYQRVLTLDPSNARAGKGIEDIAGRFLEMAREQAEKGEIGRANAYISAASQVFPRHSRMEEVRDEVAAKEEVILTESLSGTGEESSQLEEERRQRDAQRQETALKIASLVSEAESYTTSGELDLAAARYQEILDVDVANNAALDGLDAVAMGYVENALAGIAESRLDEAELNLNKARVLSPTSARYQEAQAGLIAARDEVARLAVEEEIRKEEVAKLLRAANRAVERERLYRPVGNNAVDAVLRVLEIDGNNEQALALQSEINTEIQRLILDWMDKELLQGVADALAALEKNGADVAVITGLESSLQQKEKELARRERSQREEDAQQERDRLAALEAERRAADNAARTSSSRGESPSKASPRPPVNSPTERLLAEAGVIEKAGGINQDNYRRLAQTYQEVLKLDRTNTDAGAGLGRVAGFNAEQASRAIGRGDLVAAKVQVDFLESTMPGYAGLPELKSKLAASEVQREQALGILSEADVLSAIPYKKPGMFGNNNKAREVLRMAYAKVATAREMAPGLPEVSGSEQLLVNKYSDIISTHLGKGDLEDAREFMDDLSETSLSGPMVESLDARIAQLEEESAKKPKKRIPGGSF